jgi:hypothetical protein
MARVLCGLGQERASQTDMMVREHVLLPAANRKMQLLSSQGVGKKSHMYARHPRGCCACNCARLDMRRPYRLRQLTQS